MARPPLEKDDPHRQIVPSLSGEAASIHEWLEALFYLSPRKDPDEKGSEPGKPKSEPDSMPERVVLRAISKRGGIDVGAQIKEKTWKPFSSAVPSREFLVSLANEFYSAARKDASTNGKQQRYGLFAFNNMKGSDYYERHLFVVDPGIKELKEGEAFSASDDEDTHRDRLTSQALMHTRWTLEYASKQIDGAMKAIMENNRQLMDQNNRLYEANRQHEKDRREMLLQVEEALDRKEERKDKAEWQKLQRDAIMLGAKTVAGLLPGIVAHATKGKAGAVEGLKAFVASMDQEQHQKLFGEISPEGRVVNPGIFTPEQVAIFNAILEEKIPVNNINSLIADLNPEQIMQVQSVLSLDQVQMLATIKDAIDKAEKPAEDSNENENQ
jgi:hypothetical protein